MKLSGGVPRSPRYAVEDLCGSLEIEARADLLNISLRGVAVRGPISLDVGSKATLELGAASEAIRVASEVRWRRPAHLAHRAENGLEGYYDCGLSFEEDLSQKAGELLRFLDSNTITRLTKGVWGRFELDYEVPVSLRHRSSFRVNELSSSGMLIETGAVLSPESQIELELSLEPKRFVSLARVVWVASATIGDDTLFRAAVEFTYPTERHMEILQSYIRRELEGER